MYLPNPIYHQLAFGGILLTCIARNVVLIRRLPKQGVEQAITAAVPVAGVDGSRKGDTASPAATTTAAAPAKSSKTRTLRRNARAKISLTLLQGILTFIAGFAAWNVDNVFCDQLRYGREVMARYGIGALGFLLQGEWQGRICFVPFRSVPKGDANANA